MNFSRKRKHNVTRKNSKRRQGRIQSRNRKQSKRKTKMEPQIVSMEWGSIKIKQGSKSDEFKDVILLPTGYHEWNFKDGFNSKIDKQYTSHQHKTNKTKGIQIHSVRDLLDKGDTFILTTGYTDDLGVNKNTINYLKENDKEVIVVNSADVMKIYNIRSKKGKVVALIHSTC